MHAFLRLQEELKLQGARDKVLEEQDDKLVKKNTGENDFITVKEFEEKLFQKHTVGFGHADSFPVPHSSFTIHFSTKEQPSFNRQFDLLIKDLKNWEAKKFQVYIFAEKKPPPQKCQVKK